ncbi:MAG: hypothetical protein LBM12_01540 [Candidatus Nomurabacteria bacterium]|jgi:glycosyltransferase involved in cell wall biosynthesis|nr:hypothetical protein [Candidatus Nomurabacteria bacterium]
MEPPKILVGIASYHDPELLPTLQDCLAKATHKERLVFAVVNQYDQTTQHTLDYFAKENLKLVQLDYRQSYGVGYARRLMTDLYTNEDFCLQIDAHTRFEQGWDEALLQEWRACNDPKAVLSAYPTPFTYNGKGEVIFTPYTKVAAMSVSKYISYIPIFKGTMSAAPEIVRHSIIGLSAGFAFGTGDIFAIPYIRDVCFMGEEFIRAFQLYSYGFNFYAPNLLPLFHLYDRKNTRFWHDMPRDGKQAKYSQMTANSYRFIRQLLSGSLPDYTAHFGTVRSLADYEKHLNTTICLPAGDAADVEPQVSQ